MKGSIEAISPGGYVVRLETEADDPLRLLVDLDDIEDILIGHGYAPGGQLPLSPDGLPVCPRHRVVMSRREKQGDEWFSHKLIVDGREVYCKGRPGADSPGWEVGQ